MFKLMVEKKKEILKKDQMKIKEVFQKIKQKDGNYERKKDKKFRR